MTTWDYKTKGLLLLTTALLLGCGHQAYMTEAELSAFIQDEENGLTKKHNASNIELSLTYRPNDLLVAQEVGSSTDPSEIRQAMAKYNDYAYFILNLTAGGKNALYRSSRDMGDFSDKLQTLSFRMADRVFLTTSQFDTIPVADYIFDRTYGMGSSNLLFVFAKEKLQSSDWFTFNLRDFGMNTGDQRFRFSTSDILESPKLTQFKGFDINLISKEQKSNITNQSL